MDYINRGFVIPDINTLAKHPLWQVCAPILILFYLMNFMLHDCASKLGLVTVNTLITNTYVWNIVTSAFYEKYILKLISDLISLAFICMTLDHNSLNLEQLFIYLLLSIVVSGLVTSFYCFLSLVFTAKEDLLVAPFYGFNGVLMSLCMYTRSFYKSKAIYEAYPSLTYNNAPILFALYMIICCIAGLHATCTDLPFVLTEELSFVAMFPKPLHIILIPFTTTFYNIIAITGFFPLLEEPEKKLPHHLRDSTLIKAEKQSPAPIVKPDIVADRRRTRALQLLDAKLAEIANDDDGWDGGVASIFGDDRSVPITVEHEKLKV